MQDYRNLEVWKKAHQLALAVYRATQRFPTEERFGLVSQTRRAAVSIGSNIAEGSGRDFPKEFVRFLSFAKSSASETEYQILLARDLGYLMPSEHAQLADEVAGIRQMLYRLQQTVERQISGPKQV